MYFNVDEKLCDRFEALIIKKIILTKKKVKRNDVLEEAVTELEKKYGREDV
jgi:hypothetical protein